MNSEEIEIWYDHEKQRLTEEFHAQIKKEGNQNLTKIQRVFEPKFKKLVADYNEKYARTFKDAQRKKLVKDKLYQIKKQLQIPQMQQKLNELVKKK